MNTQFADAFANRSYVSAITEGKSGDPSCDPRSGLGISNCPQPEGEYFGFPNFHHALIVAHGLQLMVARLIGLTESGMGLEIVLRLVWIGLDVNALR